MKIPFTDHEGEPEREREMLICKEDSKIEREMLICKEDSKICLCLKIELKCKTLNDNEWVVVMFCTCVAVERHLC